MDYLLASAVLVVLIAIASLVARLVMALDERDVALAESRSATRRRELLLIEYRHRMRGDLQGVSSLLRLRAKHVADPIARAALHEAAGHTVALGKIHSRLERAEHDVNEVAMVDAGQFVRDVAGDMQPPVTDAWGASRLITTERAVALGLLIVELVAEAKRDGAERMVVRLSVTHGDFVLDVIDDRPRLGETDGIRTRLIGLLAGQLRGKVTRLINMSGPGWSAAVRFPVAAPVLSPNNVGVVTAKLSAIDTSRVRE